MTTHYIIKSIIIISRHLNNVSPPEIGTLALVLYLC